MSRKSKNLKFLKLLLFSISKLKSKDRKKTQNKQDSILRKYKEEIEKTKEEFLNMIKEEEKGGIENLIKETKIVNKKPQKKEQSKIQ